MGGAVITVPGNLCGGLPSQTVNTNMSFNLGLKSEKCFCDGI